MRDNGFGKLVSLEVDAERAKRALTEIETTRLRDWVEVVVERGLTLESSKELEFALLDSDPLTAPFRVVQRWVLGR
jgi:predicted O-methyltransferase YrrM